MPRRKFGIATGIVLRLPPSGLRFLPSSLFFRGVKPLLRGGTGEAFFDATSGRVYSPLFLRWDFLTARKEEVFSRRLKSREGRFPDVGSFGGRPGHKNNKGARLPGRPCEVTCRSGLRRDGSGEPQPAQRQCP